jgi:hypothetical protein
MTAFNFLRLDTENKKFIFSEIQKDIPLVPAIHRKRLVGCSNTGFGLSNGGCTIHGF